MKKLILGSVAAAIMFLVTFALLPVQTRPAPVSATQTSQFDHSNCQYPDRWSNPANGCDNTDPAVPECIGSWSTEAEEQKCIDEFVKQQEQPAKPVQVKPAKPINQCGGK